MRIGVPKEVVPGERRVGVTPGGAEQLIAAGHEVLLQHGAGDGCGYPDEAYQAYGVTVADAAAETWDGADLVTKVKQPVPEETVHFHDDLILFSYCHAATRPWLVEALLERRVSALAFEEVLLPTGERPLLRPMSEIAGRLAVLVAAQHLAEPFGPRGVLLGSFEGRPTARVLIIGGGAAGAAAAAAARALGAAVSVVDSAPERVQAHLEAVAPGADVWSCSPDFVASLLPFTDVVINAVRWDPLTGRRVITREVLRRMPRGAVIVDIDCTPGGAIETTRVMTVDEPTFEVEGVLHYCVPNMPATVPRTSTEALGSATLPYLQRIATLGVASALEQHPELMPALVCRDGRLLSREVAEAQGRAWPDGEETP